MPEPDKLARYRRALDTADTFMSYDRATTAEEKRAATEGVREWWKHNSDLFDKLQHEDCRVLYEVIDDPELQKRISQKLWKMQEAKEDAF